MNALSLNRKISAAKKDSVSQSKTFAPFLRADVRVPAPQLLQVLQTKTTPKAQNKRYDNSTSKPQKDIPSPAMPKAPESVLDNVPGLNDAEKWSSLIENGKEQLERKLAFSSVVKSIKDTKKGYDDAEKTYKNLVDEKSKALGADTSYFNKDVRAKVFEDVSTPSDTVLADEQSPLYQIAQERKDDEQFNNVGSGIGTAVCVALTSRLWKPLTYKILNAGAPKIYRLGKPLMNETVWNAGARFAKFVLRRPSSIFKGEFFARPNLLRNGVGLAAAATVMTATYLLGKNYGDTSGNTYGETDKPFVEARNLSYIDALKQAALDVWGDQLKKAGKEIFDNSDDKAPESPSDLKTVPSTEPLTDGLTA